MSKTSDVAEREPVAVPDYAGFGAQIAGVLDGYVGADDANPIQTLSYMLDVAERFALRIGSASADL